MFPPLARITCASIVTLSIAGATVSADVGDPQIRTDHPWYPGELACSTFERLFATQAEQYERATGKRVTDDEQKALASWFWRNTHYAHAEEGSENLWGRGFTQGDLRTREYWTGLFAHGFGLCGTTHSQWTAEMQQLLGHTRGRGVGVAGHNSFEVWLTGGEYGAGRWALLDHDLSTIIFDSNGKRLLSIPEVKANWQQLIRRDFLPQKQHGWLVCGLHPGDGNVYGAYQTAEYLAGYAGPPPMVHLRRGETLRRYLQPGLESAKDFVFWARNYNSGGIPGPERNHTWVNQPERMFGSRDGAGGKVGQARYGNAVYTYVPDFTNANYQEGVVEESERHVTFEFRTPYIIAATPPNAKPWGIYDSGCTNGLVLNGRVTGNVSVSVDRGRTWSNPIPFHDGLDLTDSVKGFRQYQLRLDSGAKDLVTSGLAIRTVCQVNAAVLPRLKDDGTTITFAASQQALVSAGPTKPQAASHVVDGGFDSPSVTLKLASPKGEVLTKVYASAQVASGNPPNKEVKYHIDLSSDGGKSWQTMTRNWTVERRGDDPPDFWSQSFSYGANEMPASAKEILVRFTNTGKRNYLRAEAHTSYATGRRDETQVTFHWKDNTGEHTASHHFSPATQSAWTLPTGKSVQTRWVEFTVPGR
jgi:hypothetical protein